MSGLKSSWELSLERSDDLVPELKSKKKLTKKQKDQIHATTDSVLVLDHVSLNWAHLVHKKAPSSGTVTANLKINGPGEKII